MFDIGFSELVLVFVIGLVILGPERLPKVAAQLGRWVSLARRTVIQLSRQLEREIELSETVRPPKPPPDLKPRASASTDDSEPRVFEQSQQPAVRRQVSPVSDEELVAGAQPAESE
jgi:sec-independent protein translocase protein TatB